MANFVKKHTWVLIVIILFILMPQSLNTQSQLNMRILITGVAVDQYNDEYEITAQVVKPQKGSEGGGSNAYLDFVSAKGKTISEGLSKITYLLGKTAGLSHVNYIVFGEELASGEKFVQSLDFFLRNTKVPSSSLLLIASGSAKEELKKTESLEVSNAVGLQKIFLYKENSSNGVMMQLQSFMNNYYNLSKSGIISGFKLEEETSEDSSSSGSSSNSSSGGDSSSGGPSEASQKKMRLKYYNDIYFFKSGKMLCKITDEKQIKGINYSNPKSKEGIISVKNVDGGVFDNATVAVNAKSQEVKYKTYFDKSGVPHFDINIDLKKNEIMEISNEKQNLDLYLARKLYIDDALEMAIKKEITESVMSVYEETKNVGVDFYNIANRLYRKDFLKWKELYGNWGDSYLDAVQFKINVNIKKQK